MCIRVYTFILCSTLLLFVSSLKIIWTLNSNINNLIYHACKIQIFHWEPLPGGANWLSPCFLCNHVICWGFCDILSAQHSLALNATHNKEHNKVYFTLKNLKKNRQNFNWTVLCFWFFSMLVCSVLFYPWFWILIFGKWQSTIQSIYYLKLSSYNWTNCRAR